MLILEYVKQAFGAVWAQKLRSSLTLLSLAIGVGAIISITMVTDAFQESLGTEMAQLGQNTFLISRSKQSQGHRMGARRADYGRRDITYKLARSFKEQIYGASGISISDSRNGFRVSRGSVKTDPNVSLFGADADYILCSNREVELGRFLSNEDVMFNRPVVVVGADVVERLFPYTSPINQSIRIGGREFTVVGVLKSQGGLQDRSPDNVVMIPISLYVSRFSSDDHSSVSLMVRAAGLETMPYVIDESIGRMRVLRNLKPGEDNDFEIITNEALTQQFSTMVTAAKYFGTFSAFLALAVAGIGIMNIMLVSVRERTREIGVRKALGARRSSILWQFLIEAVALCQLGAAIGIGLATLLVGALLAAFGSGIGLEPTLPVAGSIMAIVFCTLIGVVFGFYPALRAASMDPINALRYE